MIYQGLLSFRVFGLSMGKKRADERTRTADLTSLRVRGKWLLRVAGACKSRIANGFSVLSIAHYCRILRAG